MKALLQMQRCMQSNYHRYSEVTCIQVVYDPQIQACAKWSKAEIFLLKILATEKNSQTEQTTAQHPYP